MRPTIIALAAAAAVLALLVALHYLARFGEGARAWPAVWGLRALRAIMVLALVQVVAAALLLLLEDRFVYYPTRPAADWDPRTIGAEACTFQTEDGLTLHAAWHPGLGTVRGPQPAAGPQPVVLFCHGNAGDVTNRADILSLLAQRGLAVLVFDYRGYGDSQGRPSEQGLCRDADAAWRYLVEQRGVEPGRIVVFGESLGAAVALHTALARPVAGIIMEGAFQSIPAMARRQVPFVPIWPLTHNRFDNLSSVGRLAVPLLMVHGERDELVPISQGRAVFRAAPEPKELHIVAGASHNDAPVVGGQAYLSTLERFCRWCAGTGSRESLPSG